MMKGIFYDLNTRKLLLKKMKLGRKYSMIIFREDWEIPEISHPNQIQVKSRFSGICTSDLHQIDVNLPYSATILAKKINPIPMEHEVVGEITQIGEDANAFSRRTICISCWYIVSSFFFRHEDRTRSLNRVTTQR